MTLLFISTTVLVVSQRGRPPSQQLLLSKRNSTDSSGVLVNEEKSHWVPTQVGEWLGFVINTISMTFQIPEKKVCELKNIFFIDK